MIKKLFILQTTGQCIIYMDFEFIESKNANSVKKDPQLISGFFSAIIVFAENVVAGRENPINQIQMKTGNYIFSNIGGYYVILETTVTDSSLNLDDYNFIIAEIGDVFYASFCKNGDSNDIFFSRLIGIKLSPT